MPPAHGSAQRLDAVVVGAGAVGASAALHLAARGMRVALVEKEAAPAMHQSGRNSGVVHAGYNLKPGSGKARFCAAGNRELKAWCRVHGVALAELGAFVVARDEDEAATLRELERRAAANGVAARVVDADRLREAEPHAQGVAALHAPEVASLDAGAFVGSVVAAARQAGADVRLGAAALRIEEDASGALVRTTAGTLEAAVAVNAAGLHADRLAGTLARDVRIVPFRGTYAELVPARRGLVRSHLYATPDLRFPFLGVHLSRRADGRVLAGPGAMLALGREAYSLGRIHLGDVAALAAWPGFWRLMARRDVRRLVGRELRKSLDLGAVAREACRLVAGLQRRDLVPASAGNRAQLVSRGGELVDDIVVRESARAVHVLNAVSPGLTCSLPFGRHLAERALALAEGTQPATVPGVAGSPPARLPSRQP